MRQIIVQQVPNRGDGGLLLPLEDQAVRGVAVPAVVVSQHGDQGGRACLAEFGRRRDVKAGGLKR